MGPQHHSGSSDYKIKSKTNSKIRVGVPPKLKLRAGTTAEEPDSKKSVPPILILTRRKPEFRGYVRKLWSYVFKIR